MSGSPFRLMRSIERGTFTAGCWALQERPAPRQERLAFYGPGEPGFELHVVVAERPPDDTALHHFALEVEDLEAHRRRLDEAGYETLPSRPLDARERFFVRDPFGNLIELLTEPHVGENASA